MAIPNLSPLALGVTPRMGSVTFAVRLSPVTERVTASPTGLFDAFSLVPGEYRDDLRTALNEPRLVTALLNDPGLLERAAEADRPALTELRELLPNGNLRSLLDLYLGAADGWVGRLAGALAGGDLQAQARAQLAPLGQLAPVLRRPDVQQLLRLLVTAELPIGTLLRDVGVGRFDPARLLRVIGGQGTLDDAATLLAYLRDLKGGTWVVPPGLLTQALALARLPSGTADFIESVRVGPGDQVTLRLRELPAHLRAQLPRELNQAREVTFSFAELRQGRIVRDISIGFHSTMRLVSDALCVHPTGNTFIDGLLSVLLHLLAGLLFPLLFLTWLIGRPKVRLTLSATGVTAQARAFCSNLGSPQRL